MGEKRESLGEELRKVHKTPQFKLKSEKLVLPEIFQGSAKKMPERKPFNIEDMQVNYETFKTQVSSLDEKVSFGDREFFGKLCTM